MAQVIGLPGETRLANNLNLLAYHANMSTLLTDERTTAQINETYDHVCFMRAPRIEA